jgi:hypothetical protein
MSTHARRARRGSVLRREIVRWIRRRLWRLGRALFLVMAAVSPGLPPPPPPPPPPIELLDSGGEVLDED